MELAEFMMACEDATGTYLVPHCPAILRVDGRAFKTFTKGFNKPFDRAIEKAMKAATIALCKDISTAKLGYTQSDEISILMIDYENPGTQQWFGGKTQKIVSVAAANATRVFIRCLWNQAQNVAHDANLPGCLSKGLREAIHDRAVMLGGKIFQPEFDARIFSMRPGDVKRYFIWRYLDARNNSVMALARTMFGHRELQGVTRIQALEMMRSKGVEWTEYPVHQQEGRIILKVPYRKEVDIPNRDPFIVDATKWAAMDEENMDIVTIGGMVEEYIPEFQHQYVPGQ